MATPTGHSGSSLFPLHTEGPFPRSPSFVSEPEKETPWSGRGPTTLKTRRFLTGVFCRRVDVRDTTQSSR